MAPASSRRRRDHDFSLRVISDLRSAAYDDVSASPWSFAEDKRPLLGHPVDQILDGIRASRLADAVKAPPVGNTLVGLHPDQGIDEVRRLGPARANSLDYEQPAPSGNS